MRSGDLRGDPLPGHPPSEEGLLSVAESSDGIFRVGRDGVESITVTRDGKVEFITVRGRTLANVRSSMGYPAYYVVHPVRLEKPILGVLMDLDGTSVRSEGFWVWVIQLTVASLLGDPSFHLEEADLPYVSGHSVSEHLSHCIRKYCPGRTLEEARSCYFEHARREMREIAEGRGRQGAFEPSHGLREFLLDLKSMGVKIGLVTSGLYEKAWPEVLSAFRTMDLGDPRDFYDAIITAGFALGKGHVGTLGELSPKPHPWLYAETCRVGLGIAFEDRHRVVGIDDTGAGVCAIRLAGFTSIGMSGGNIDECGARQLCDYYCHTFEQVLAIIK